MAEVAIVATIGCLIALLGIFTPGDMPLGLRMAFWIIGSVTAWALMKVLARSGAAAAKLVGLSEVWGYVIAIPLGSAVISWCILWWLGGASKALGESFALIWPSTILVGLGYFGLFFVIYSRDRAASPLEPDYAPDPQILGASGLVDTPLHQRLSLGFPAILALSVEDHYTRVHAAERSEMVLMSLSEAMALMPPKDGRQVHRSWWVSQSAVESHKRGERDIKLSLINGLEVPVSRTHTKALREAGWLD